MKDRREEDETKRGGKVTDNESGKKASQGRRRCKGECMRKEGRRKEGWKEEIRRRRMRK